MSAVPGSRALSLQWRVVLAVGVLVIAVVLGLRLIPRLNAGQKVLDGARPAFAAPRVAADRAGVNIVSHVVDMADPIVGHKGGATAEVPAAVAYLAKTRHVSNAAAMKLLQTSFPHTAALLTALPLSSVTKELPQLEAFLATTLKLTPDELQAALKKNFPALTQTIANLPTVTRGWDQVPNIGRLTRFGGGAVHSVPQLRDYFSKDLIPVVERQQGNFRSLDGTSRVNWIAPLLLMVGLVVAAFAVLMGRRVRSGIAPRTALAGAVVVPVVGVVVVGLVVGVSLIPRVSNGQKLLDDLKPAMTKQRVVGDRAGITMVSAIVDTADPIMTPSGGAAAEVPKLVAFVADRTGLTQGQVLSALGKRFPHTTALLQAIPLTGVAAELPRLSKILAPALSAVPHLAQTIKATPLVTGGWLDVPGTTGATRFNGSAITTVPDVRDYLGGDVIPVLEHQRTHYARLTSVSNIDFIGPLVLVVGLIVVAFGLLMVMSARRQGVAVPQSAPAVRAV